MIEFVQVTKQYPTGQTALSDVSFAIKEGELVLFTGESGAGKTSIMRMLIRDLFPTTGEVRFLDNNVSKLRGKQIIQLRRDISVVFQDYKLLMDFTVAENIGLPLEIQGMKKQEIEGRVKDLLELVSLQEKDDFFPSQLSGGEAQRVSIARALAVGPKVLFADEPTGNLDRDTSLSIAKLLKKIHELGTTICMATHNLELQNILKGREIHLHQGKVVKDNGKKDDEHKEEKKEEKYDEKREEKKIEKPIDEKPSSREPHHKQRREDEPLHVKEEGEE